MGLGLDYSSFESVFAYCQVVVGVAAAAPTDSDCQIDLQIAILRQMDYLIHLYFVVSIQLEFPAEGLNHWKSRIHWKYLMPMPIYFTLVKQKDYWMDWRLQQKDYSILIMQG